MLLKNVKLLLPLLTLPALLLGCGPEASDTGGVLPDVKPYSAAFQNRAADELEKAGPPCPADVVIEGCSATHRLVIDYLDMRDQNRSIAGK